MPSPALAEPRHRELVGGPKSIHDRFHAVLAPFHDSVARAVEPKRIDDAFAVGGAGNRELVDRRYLGSLRHGHIAAREGTGHGVALDAFSVDRAIDDVAVGLAHRLAAIAAE